MLLVALGGSLGALSRFGLGKALQHWNPHAHFSVGTLLANLLGCFLMGALVVIIGGLSDTQREVMVAFLLTGFLGSLTTFSTFILEFFKLNQSNEPKLIVMHLLGHLALGVAGLWIGHSLAQRFFISTS